MAQLKIKRGLSSSLPTIEDGSLLITTDTKKIYLDNGSNRIELTTPPPVQSVNGKTGAVSLTYADVGAPSINGSGASGTWGINITGNAATATKATQDSSGNTITSKYVTIDTAQTISGSKTFSSMVKMTKGYTVYSSYGTNGTGGHVKIATLKITGAYQNAPISFKFIRRGDKMPTIISIQFTNTDSTDPTLSAFTGYGYAATAAYLHKSATSVWDLYITKSEGYDTVHIIDFNNSYNGSTSITWVANTQVATLPTGGITCSWGGTIQTATVASSVAWGNVTGKPSSYTPASHTHSEYAAASHTHDYLPLSGGNITGNVSFPATASSTSPTAQRISINGVPNDHTVANAPGIGFHIGGLNWGSLKFQSDGSFRFYDADCTGYKPVYGSQIYGAVWNDYAEFRESNEQIQPGRVVIENGDDTLSISTKRLQPGASIVSDTYGFAIGETSRAKTPLAVSGRALAYPYEPRDTFSAGDAVCSGPNGTVSKMTREEIVMYPERIIGTVSAIPDYETWGTGNVPVNGRIWIKVK